MTRGKGRRSRPTSSAGSLTFEVIADAGEPDLAAIASDLAGRQIGFAGADGAPTLAGFAADGEDVRDATLALTALHDLQWRDGAGALTLVAGVETGRSLGAGAEIVAIDGERAPAGARQRAPIETIPVRLAVRHHDPARDYQAGIQTAERSGPGMRSETVDLPAALAAGEARRLADRKLRASLRRRTMLHRAMGWGALDLAAGDVVALADEPGRWLVEGCDWDDMAVRLTLRAIGTGTRPVADAGASGAPVLEEDVAQGATSLAIVEWPPDGSTLASAPAVVAAATGADAGWRRAALLRYRPELASAEPIGRTAPRAVIGTATTVLPDGPTWRIDRRGSVEIQLDNDGDALVGAGDEQLFQSANLCVIGDEWLQFGAAEPVGPGRYRLSQLLRGWHGTEWACAAHGADERFVLIETARLASVPLSAGDVGQWLSLRAIGSGDDVPAQASRLIDGRAMLPPAPVHGRLSPQPGGDLALRWIRRSRLGWGWADAGEVPLGEEREAYALRVTAGGALLRQWETAAPSALYRAADDAADRAAAGSAPRFIEIRQLGTWGASRPLMIALP